MVRLHLVRECDVVKRKVVSVWLDYTQNVIMVVIYIAVLVQITEKS